MWVRYALKGIGVVLFAAYFIGTSLALSYYNWQYARDHATSTIYGAQLSSGGRMIYSLM